MQWRIKKLNTPENTDARNPAQTEKRKRGEYMKLTEIVDLPRSEWENLIDEWIFSERDRQILKRRLLDGVCYEPLAEEFDMSVQQIRSVTYKMQNRLFKHIK